MPPVRADGRARFGYRGAHLDICRHFYGPDEVKTFIDMMALHGLNRLHWHLSDDQGWRIEIKKYPLLTAVGSHRDSTVIGRNSGVWDHTPVDGFFTQQQARQIVEYAADRGIEVVPEIDMPGHMLAAMAAYPWLGCTGGPYPVWTEWGVTDRVLCPGEPRTMKFITDVLNEIMDIFPSQLIHIGGDECPKSAWRDCPKCQALIDSLGLTPQGGYSAEDRLQGYVTRHAYDVCRARGRRIIGWDEILQGDIPNDAVVMVWQGTRALPEAMRRGHEVILAPDACMYFDFYQTKDTDAEPFAIGGFTPVEKVFRFNPDSLAGVRPELLLGVQANLWTEYIADMRHVQYMELPRMAALAEVQWRQPERVDWEDFRARVPRWLALYDSLGYNYARHITEPSAVFTPDTLANTVDVTMSALPGWDIRYTLDGTDPGSMAVLYGSPLKIAEDTRLRYASFGPQGRGRVLTDTLCFNRATARPVSLLTTPAPGYEAAGAATLTDGLTSSYNYRTGRAVGFSAEPLQAVVDLGNGAPVTEVSFNALVFCCDGVVDAAVARVELSDDGVNYRTAATWVNGPVDAADEFTVKSHTIALPQPQAARYVRLTVEPCASLPAWHNLAGARGFLFVDELSIR